VWPALGLSAPRNVERADVGAAAGTNHGGRLVSVFRRLSDGKDGGVHVRTAVPGGQGQRRPGHLGSERVETTGNDKVPFVQ
jgi:hypothetical protein